MLTIGDLIKNKDYDYISYRLTPPEDWPEESIFAGICKSKNGELIPLDGDTYCKSEEVVFFEEWCDDEVKNGLTVVVKTEWTSTR